MHENRYSIQNQLETIQNRKCWLFLHLVPPQVHHFIFSRTTVDRVLIWRNQAKIWCKASCAKNLISNLKFPLTCTNNFSGIANYN